MTLGLFFVLKHQWGRPTSAQDSHLAGRSGTRLPGLSVAMEVNAYREHRRRNKYRLCMIDEIHHQLGRATPFEDAKIRASRKKYLLKLFKYKRRAAGANFYLLASCGRVDPNIRNA